MKKVWHIRFGSYGRAYCANPSNPFAKAYLFFKGWRQFNSYWWSKPSKNQRTLEEKIKKGLI